MAGVGGGGGGALGRSYRRFRRRPPATQAATVAVVLVVVVGVVVGAVLSAGSSSGPKTTTTVAAGGAPALAPPSSASTSAAGVTSSTITVVFPVSNLTSLSSNFGFAGDLEFNHQEDAIHTFVNAINDGGGIDGRKIVPDIVSFDPTNEVTMRALCKQWTEGGAQVFAVIDGVGSWSGDNELCITQEGHTPFIGQWTTVSSWLAQGSPYLWWLGPDQSVLLNTLVHWADSAGLVGPHVKVGVVVGDRASDQAALTGDVLPALRRAGVTDPVVETLPAQLSETAGTSAAAPLVVQKLAQAGVTSVIPLVPFNAFFPYLQAETSQRYYPKLLLSDYESTIGVSLGLIPVPFEQALDNQEGITVETLGGTDAPVAAAKGGGGYDAGVQSCYETWKAHNPPVSSVSPYIEEQGPIVGWCEAIRLFATAAQKAGRDLNRRTFAEAMASISDFPGTWSTVLSFSATKHYGPTQYQVVSLHNNVPPSPLCVPTYTGKPQGTCWHVITGYRPLVDG